MTVSISHTTFDSLDAYAHSISKQVKNRVHLDLQPSEPGGRDRELQRLLALGATQVDDQRRPDGKGWVVLADPEGNEFCILRSEAERTA